MSLFGSGSTALSRSGERHQPVAQLRLARGQKLFSTEAETPAGSGTQWRFVVAGISTVLALLGFAAAGRRRKPSGFQRIEPVPSRALAEFGRFTQELAHEIRNPLTAINARLYKLQKRLAPGTPEFRDAAIIENEIKRLDQMLETFRTLGWAGPPQPVLLRGEVVVKEVCELLSTELERRGIQVQCETRPDLQVRVDPQQLKQVLINLIKNAAESISEPPSDASAEEGTDPKSIGCRGSVRVKLHRDTAQPGAEKGSTVIFEVQDDGPGVPEAVRARMFEPFFSTKELGTGLGLPIAARIVAQHGGALEFESRPEKGSTFRVLLPEAES